MRKITAKDVAFAEKVAHVKGAPFIGGHLCHYPGCTTEVKPAYWGCMKHWYTIPKHLRDKIWLHYAPRQEITKKPSPEYLAAANEIQEWIAKNGK